MSKGSMSPACTEAHGICWYGHIGSGGDTIPTPHFPYQPCWVCRKQQQNYLM